jgi:uncharacterized membrane protein YkoI
MKRLIRVLIPAVCVTIAVALTVMSGTAIAARAKHDRNNRSAPVDDGQYIGVDKAKEIALSDAGVSESAAVFTKERLDRDDGRVVYELKFSGGDTRYDYEIDAVSGDIRDFGRKTTVTAQAAASVDASQYIGEARAKEIALSDAGLAESDVRKIKAKLDREDGRKVYEVEFKCGQTEYEYEIDPVSGAILKSDIEYDD